MFAPERGDGLRLSNELDLYLQAALSGVYDTNIYDTPTLEQSDFVAVFRPSLELATRLPRHGLRFNADAEIRRYAQLTGENSEQFGVAASGLLELGERIDVRSQVGYARRIERRGTSGDQFLTDSPVEYDEKYANLDISRSGGVLQARLTGSVSKKDYRDTSFGGVPIDLTERDALVARGGLRVDYSTSERMRVFVEVSGSLVEYDINPFAQRDSSGFAVIGGIRYEVTRLIQVEAGLGYIHQSFADPAYASVGGVNYWVSAEWTPTPFWLITARANKNVEPSPVNASPAIVHSTIVLNVKRAIGDRLLLEANAETTGDTYWLTTRSDRIYRASLSGRYRLTPNIGLTAGVGYRKRTSDAAFAADYQGFEFSFGITALW